MKRDLDTAFFAMNRHTKTATLLLLGSGAMLLLRRRRAAVSPRVPEHLLKTPRWKRGGFLAVNNNSPFSCYRAGR